MLRLLEDLPDQVLGVEALGEVTAEDYREVLVPAVEARLGRHARVRLLYVLGKAFDGFSGGATWEDAKLGMHHFTAFERVAVVTDRDWLKGMVKAFGFALPGEVATFETGQLAEARAWIGDLRGPGSLEFELREDVGVLILRPRDELVAADFERVEAVVDPYLTESGGLAGLMVVADEFPGWDSFPAMTAHFRFVREHQDKLRRVALVTSDRFLSALPRLAQRFLAAEVRRFEPGDEEAALRWTSSSSR